MKNILRQFSLSVALVTFSGIASAHPGLLPHPETSSVFIHFLLHALMVFPLAVSAFFLSRLLRRHSQQARGKETCRLPNSQVKKR